jgi:hypothetical protein
VTARDAKRKACSIAALHVRSYFDVGQPYDDMLALDDFTDEDLANANRLHRALCELHNELNRRAGSPFKEIEHKPLTRAAAVGG